jgi:hypothetical protein
MATLKLTSIRCHRKHDVAGDDEPVLRIDSAKVWDGVMNTNQDQVKTVNKSHVFTGTASVTLDELSNGKYKQIGGAFPVKESGNAASMNFKTAGTHYEVFFTVS